PDRYAPGRAAAIRRVPAVHLGYADRAGPPCWRPSGEPRSRCDCLEHRHRGGLLHLVNPPLRSPSGCRRELTDSSPGAGPGRARTAGPSRTLPVPTTPGRTADARVTVAGLSLPCGAGAQAVSCLSKLDRETE